MTDFFLIVCDEKARAHLHWTDTGVSAELWFLLLCCSPAFRGTGRAVLEEMQTSTAP